MNASGAGARPAYMLATLAAVLSGAMVANLLYCAMRGSFEAFVSQLYFAAFIAFVLMALAAPPIARVVLRGRPLTPGRAVWIGALAAVLPAAAGLLIGVAREAYLGHRVELDPWFAGLGILAVSGAFAGLVFEALHEPSSPDGPAA